MSFGEVFIRIVEAVAVVAVIWIMAQCTIAVH